MGTVVRVKGIKRYRHPETGRWYCYHRKSGTPISAEFGSAEFFADLQRWSALRRYRSLCPAAWVWSSRNT